MFLEPQKPGDPFEVSDADTMLRYLAPNAEVPEPVAILTREGCSFCAQAKKMLSEAGYDYAEIAGFLRTSPGNVGSILSRSHAALRLRLAGEPTDTHTDPAASRRAVR